MTELDVRAILPTIRVSTLVVHHADDAVVRPEWGKDVADHIPSAKYVELPGRNAYHFVEPTWRESFQAIHEFLTGQQADVADDRVLATVLFTDIVDSTRRAARDGATVTGTPCLMRTTPCPSAARSLPRPRGEHIGRQFPRDVRRSAASDPLRHGDSRRGEGAGIEVRAGLHTGECEVRGDDIGGIGVHIGARVSALAGPNDVLVSSTLRDLVIGSGLEFEERGSYELKGVPGEWRLFAVRSA